MSDAEQSDQEEQSDQRQSAGKEVVFRIERYDEKVKPRDNMLYKSEQYITGVKRYRDLIIEVTGTDAEVERYAQEAQFFKLDLVQVDANRATTLSSRQEEMRQLYLEAWDLRVRRLRYRLRKASIEELADPDALWGELREAEQPAGATAADPAQIRQITIRPRPGLPPGQYLLEAEIDPTVSQNGEDYYGTDAIGWLGGSLSVVVNSPRLRLRKFRPGGNVDIRSVGDVSQSVGDDCPNGGAMLVRGEGTTPNQYTLTINGQFTG